MRPSDPITWGEFHEIYTSGKMPALESARGVGMAEVKHVAVTALSDAEGTLVVLVFMTLVFLLIREYIRRQPSILPTHKVLRGTEIPNPTAAPPHLRREDQ